MAKNARRRYTREICSLNKKNRSPVGIEALTANLPYFVKFVKVSHCFIKKTRMQSRRCHLNLHSLNCFNETTNQRRERHHLRIVKNMIKGEVTLTLLVLE